MQKIRKEVRMVEITCVYEKLVEQLVVNPKAMCDVYNSSLSKYFEEPYCEVDYWNFIDFVHEHFVKYLGEGIGHPGTTPVPSPAPTKSLKPISQPPWNCLKKSGF